MEVSVSVHKDSLANMCMCVRVCVCASAPPAAVSACGRL